MIPGLFNTLSRSHHHVTILLRKGYLLIKLYIGVQIGENLTYIDSNVLVLYRKLWSRSIIQLFQQFFFRIPAVFFSAMQCWVVTVDPEKRQNSRYDINQRCDQKADQRCIARRLRLCKARKCNYRYICEGMMLLIAFIKCFHNSVHCFFIHGLQYLSMLF